jgi:hypothetical protein
MRVSIFQANGFDQISELEAEINDWVERKEKMGFSVEIKHSATATSQISYGPEEERLPHCVITIWYDLASNSN